ncbi:MAG: CDP-alcohol phosphatidyltransferase [Coriobacteriales bacterium]|nr:CDP-alcohol phosphatidyltransferase [Coriobacteriales bacterium]
MGLKAAEPIDITAEELPTYLRMHHSVYMDVNGKSYYLTDVNDHYWRAQDTEKLNEKGHYCDVSEPLPTIDEFLSDPAIDGKSVMDLVEEAAFYPSVKPEVV